MSQRLRILICDDLREQRLIAATALRHELSEEFEIAIEEAPDGQAALDLLKQGGFDLMLLDYRMPRLDGLEVLRERQRLHLDVPVVFVTAQADRDIVIEAMKLGASDFVAKEEFAAQRLPQVVRSSLERSRLRSDVARTDKLAAIGTLAGGVAHEFNNILQVILGQAQFALTRDEPERWKRALEQARDAAEKGARIVRQLLSFTGSSKSAPVKFRLEEAVQEALEMEQALARQDGVELRMTTRQSPVILGDRVQLVQVLLNLLTNARHACVAAAARGADYRGQIDITLDADDEHARVSVSDNGIGMNPAAMRRLFEPFFTTKGSLGGRVFDGKATGTGLGLSICQRIAAEHDGRIDVSSAPGRGSTFTLQLPRAHSHSRGDTRKRHKDHENDRTTTLVDPELKGRSVLVLDDEPLIAGLVSSYLGEKGLHCDVALDIEHARTLAAGRGYDLFLFDLSLPTGSSADLLRELRQQAHNSVPALAMTGHGASDSDQALYQAGFRSILRKPFVMSEMGRAVLDTLRSAAVK
ncbi:MAG: hypothetical protein DCC64_12675 [Planctomycetota bacterium]|nr:MAG: hypothetical protein DCC64_12675 [Planctomycetota bacterium]